MSRIYEALQQAERLQRNKAAEEPKKFLKGNVDDTPTVDILNPHDCKESAVRVRREGLGNFLCRLVGMYPWQCSPCRRCFYRFRRTPFL